MVDSNNMHEEALPFVLYNPAVGKFEINEETREFLRSLEGPIGVLSVAGMYRSGKSYLLNRVLLNRARGFDVGHTINACTKVSKISQHYLSQKRSKASRHRETPKTCLSFDNAEQVQISIQAEKAVSRKKASSTDSDALFHTYP
mmetsp:Transcript_19014/g.25736  ORF Transcript_19014/g.25736 Transcript_19014/m.25736 type:complete len:144 (+) Transcript_19014:141-572(+)